MGQPDQAASGVPMARCGPTRPRRPGRLAGLMLLAGAVTASGCGLSQGQLLWAMGFDRRFKTPAEFELTPDGAVLVLVDDPEERLQSPETRIELARKVGERLEAHEASGRLVSQSKLSRLRREESNFEDITCRQLGEKTGADQVLWIQVRDFHADPEVDETIHAARMSVTVKVVNALAEQPDEVRLWPVDRDGRIVSAELHATEVLRAKNPRAISGKLTDKMADLVAKLFYDHPIEDE